MLSGAGTDYIVSGFSWANPQKITYSFPSDGVPWDQGTNDLNAKLDSQIGPGWKREFAKAMATWAAVANVEAIPVSDSNDPFNTNGDTQDDPRFGDVRVGGYNFNNDQTLAQTYYPPPNGLTAAGDVEVNTGFNWSPSSPYDFFSVMLHETGHSFGLEDVPHSTSVENTSYAGVRAGLTNWDVEGIQAIYGPRQPDRFQAQGQGVSFATALDLTGQLNTSAQATVPDVSLVSIGDTEYYSVVAPAGSNEVLSAAAWAQDMSSLSPKVTIYDNAGHVLATDADPAAWSNNVQANAAGVQPGQRYFIAVAGATGDVFSVGAYGFEIAFQGANTSASTTSTPTDPTPTPPVPAPVPPTPGATPISPPPTSQASPPQTPTALPPVAQPAVARATVAKDFLEPNGPGGQPADVGSISSLVVPGLTLASASDVNVIGFRPARSGTVAIATGSTSILVMNQFGQKVASGVSSVSFQAPHPWVKYFAVLTSADGQANPGYALGIVVLPASTWNPWASSARQAVDSPSPAWGLVAPATPAAVADAPAWSYKRVEVVNSRLWRPGF